MRILERNKSDFWYALYEGSAPYKDSEGRVRPGMHTVYKTPVKARAHVSYAYGHAQSEQFGIVADYDKVIITDDMESPIDEYTVLCVDREPSYTEDGDLIYDYIVKKVAKSFNTISYAISKVTVS